jgi:hypothetical protein
MLLELELQCLRFLCTISGKRKNTEALAASSLIRSLSNHAELRAMESLFSEINDD